MSKAVSNHCPVCTAPIGMDKLMCRRHWSLLSLATQRAVHDALAWCKAITEDAPWRARANAAAFYARTREAAIKEARQAAGLDTRVRIPVGDPDVEQAQ